MMTNAHRVTCSPASPPPSVRRGATLIEAMTAFAVLSIAFSGFAASLIAARRQDRVNDARGEAQLIANDLVAHLARWSFGDPRLSLQNNHAGRAFSHPEVTDFTVTPATAAAPASVTETFNARPDHGEAELTEHPGRDLSVANRTSPGSAHIYRRYWNVIQNGDNPFLKIVAVHVTYSRDASHRGVVSAYTAVHDQAAVTRRLMGE